MSTLSGYHTYPPPAYSGPKDNDAHTNSFPESALGTDDQGEGTYELHSLSTHISERTRRPSTITRIPRITHAEDEEKFKDSSLHVSPNGSRMSLPAPRLEGPSLAISEQANKKFRRTGIIQFVTLCWCIFVEGWNDGSTGPLLPVIQRDHHVGFSIVSLYFVFNCIGFITAAGMNVWLNDKIGFGKIMALGAAIQLTSYVIQAPGPSFPVMVFANMLCGFGMSLQDVQANGYVGNLKQHMTTKIGILHAAYGLGGFTAPFIATYFSGTRHWTFHYLVSAVMAVSNTLALILVFRFKPLDELLAEAGQVPDEVNTSEDSKFVQILGLRAVHILAFFALIYIGIEVTLGGWIVTYILHERGGGHSTGYISSGFWGGLTLGRIGLMWFNKLVGEYQAIFIYSLLTIGLEFTIWFIPSIIENAVAVSLIGLILGPMFPILVSHATKVLPRWLLTVCLGWITGIGMAGSAGFPFITGLLSSRFGIGALQPLLVSMMCVMLITWAFVPKGIRRVD